MGIICHIAVAAHLTLSRYLELHFLSKSGRAYDQVVSKWVNFLFTDTELTRRK